MAVLSRRMRIVGWCCVLGIALVIVELVRVLAALPADWWHPEQATGTQFEIREMWVDLGWPAWIGAWGYLAAFVWLPVAVVKAWRASRKGLRPGAGDWLLVGLLLALLCGAFALDHFTPPGYFH